MNSEASGKAAQIEQLDAQDIERIEQLDAKEIERLVLAARGEIQHLLAYERDETAQIDQLNSVQDIERFSVKSEASGKAAQIEEQDVERLILDAAGAARRLVAERDALRSRVDTLECEVILLRQRNTLIHSYRKLATEFIAKVQLLDSEFRDCSGAYGIRGHYRIGRAPKARLKQSQSAHNWVLRLNLDTREGSRS